MNKIFLITFVAISLFSSICTSAQEQQQNREEGKFDREAFEAKRNAFITAEMNLTPEEAAAFIPLCDELRKKKFEAGQACRKLSREIKRKETPTDQEYLAAIDECTCAHEKEGQLEKEYYERFKQILPAEKLYRYREAEYKFARHFMKDQERGREHNRHGRDNNNDKR